MKTHTRTLLRHRGLACLSLLGATVLASTPTAPTTPVAPRVHVQIVTGTDTDLSDERMRWMAQAGGPQERREIRMTLAGRGDGGRLIKGAPYCADALTESTQWLVDPSNPGQPNRITHKTSSRLCRDGEGRTRQEIDLGGRKQVMLRDPVSNENWMLDPERKLASKGGGMRLFMSHEAREPSPSQAAASVEQPQIRRHVETQVVRIGGSGRIEAHSSQVADQPIPSDVVRRALSIAPRGPGVTSPLPERDFDGVKAHGERTTWTIEAGRMGNEKPIVQTREVWTSPELMLTLYSKDTDPRQGETVYRLQNLKRGEPDAALFKLPEGYQLLDRQGPRGPMGPGGRPMPGGPAPMSPGRG